MHIWKLKQTLTRVASLHRNSEGIYKSLAEVEYLEALSSAPFLCRMHALYTQLPTAPSTAPSTDTPHIPGVKLEDAIEQREANAWNPTTAIRCNHCWK